VGGEAIVHWEQIKSNEDNRNKWTKLWEQRLVYILSIINTIISLSFNKFFHNYYRVASKIIHIEISQDSTLIATVGEVFLHILLSC